MENFDVRGVVSQYIDHSGKLRMLEYMYRGARVQVMVAPMAPLNVPAMEKLAIRNTSLEIAMDFISEKGWGIVGQRILEDNLDGIWLNIIDVKYAFLPVSSTEILRDVPVSEVTPPLIEKDDSSLQLFRNARLLSSLLKDYALYTYSLDPDSFGGNSFVVIPDHVYEINRLNKKLFFEDNDVMYQDGRMIVTSRSIRNRLIKYVQIKLTHDRPGVMNFVRNTTITSYYQNIFDFTPRENQLVFVDMKSIKRWKTNLVSTQNKNQIKKNISVESPSSPYYYVNYNIQNGRLSLIQHVEQNSKENSIKVAETWSKYKVNIGYAAATFSIDEPRIGYIVYDENGTIVENTTEGDAPAAAHLITYTLDETDAYAAILFL